MLQKERIQKILIIKLRAIGDVLLSTPVATNLRSFFPDAQIDFLVEEFASAVLLNNPFISNVISLNRKKQNPLFLIHSIRTTGYDLVIDLFANPRSAIITLLSGAPYRVGFPFKWRRYSYNIITPPRSATVHNVEFNLDALRKLKIPLVSTNPQFFLNDDDYKFASSFIESNGLREKEFITVNIGGGWETKRWKTDKFISLSKKILNELSIGVVILYGPAEELQARAIAEQSGAVLAPFTSLHQMGAIMKASKLLITNDSGPMHIAASLNVPTLAIFGPTDPKLQGPYGNISEIVQKEDLECLKCNKTTCPIGNICMTTLDAEVVFEKLDHLMRKIESSRKLTEHK
ncbi:MAG: glycosyltransferase family 9 protein [Candidatus Kryptoniota bacterium]